jgi:hypothetical protein
MRRFACAALLTALAVASSPADEKLKGIACRSVHLAYPAREGAAFYNEMTVEKSAEGSYFMAAGWTKGYFGLQELANGKKLVIFSVWDPTTGDNPMKVDEEKRVKVRHKDDAVRVKRFGGEGTGGQSFFDYDWKLGETYRFLVTAKQEDAARTAYSAYFYHNEKKEWKHLVTFSTIVNGKLVMGYYSFVEDFRRNTISTTKERRASYGNGWAKMVTGDWVQLDSAKFTADANPVLNIDAGAKDARFFLTTGGDTENKTAKLRDTIPRAKEKVEAKPPADLPKIEEPLPKK